jgi:hypothetical protein
MFTGSYPNWENRVAQANSPRLQPLLEIDRGLLQKGLIDEEIMWTFLYRGVQPLLQREAAVGMSPGPSCFVRPSFSRPSSIKANARVQETLAPGDLAGDEARRACRERLWLQWLKRRVEGDLELMCSRVSYVGKPSTVASPLADRGILHLPWVSFF